MRRGHEETLFLDWILLGAGVLMFLGGDASGLLLAALGLFIHFAMGGFATGM